MEAEGKVRKTQVRNEPCFTVRRAADRSDTRHMAHGHEHLHVDQPYRPPLAYVVVKDASPITTVMSSTPTSISSARESTKCPRPFSSAFLPTAVPASPFKLQPRGKAANKRPFGSPSKGRKRTACSLHLQEHPPETCREETLVGRSHAVENGSTLSPNCNNPDVCLESPSAQRKPVTRMEVSMESLSLKSHESPRLGNDLHPQISNEREGYDMKKRTSLPPRAPANFAMVWPPSGGQFHTKSRSDKLGTLGSSIRILPSSPEPYSTPSTIMHAPRAVLPMVGSGDRTPKHMSRHLQKDGSAFMMLSLEGRNSREEFDEIPDETGVAAPPYSFCLPASDTCSPYDSTTSSITKEYTPASRFGFNTPLTPRNNGQFSSPLCLSSPANTAKQTIESAHSTPLPSIKLTPRTPRTSASRNDTTEHATPLSARDLGLLQTDFIEDDAVPSSQNLSMGWTGSHSHLPIPRWFHDAATVESPERPRTWALPHVVEQRSFDGVTEVRRDDDGRLPPFGTRSLLVSPPSCGVFDGTLLDQAEADVLMNGEDGSLSDPDEDIPFVLMNPAAVAEARYQFGPAKRRQRVSYSPLDQHGHRPSNVMAPSPFASNASLLGVGFLMGESTSSLCGDNGCGGNKMISCDESTGVSVRGSSFHEHSSVFASHRGNKSTSCDGLFPVGLVGGQGKEGNSTTTDRDPVTPPATDYHSKRSQMLQEDAYYHHDSTPNLNVRISQSNPEAVRETIAGMPFKSGLCHNASPRQLKCPS